MQFAEMGNMSGKTLKPYHKLRVENIGSTNWVYMLEVEPTAEFAQADGSQKQSTYKVVKSYRYKEGPQSNAQNVKWATEINIGGRDPGTEKWVRIANYTATAHNKPGWISFANKDNGNGGIATESRPITATAVAPVTVNNPDASFKDAISMNTHPGNAIEGKNNLNGMSEAIDLSMYDLQGNQLSGRTTANCYVVSAPGWYKFPLVMGNGIKWGGYNMQAFNYYGNRPYPERTLATFLDYLDGKDVGDSVTTLEASVESHLAALAAEQSRLQGGMPVELGPMRG